MLYIISVIQGVLFILIPIIVLLIACLRGFKRNIFQSLAKVIMTILAIIISVVIVKLVAPTIVTALLPHLLTTADDELSAILLTSSITAEASKIFSAILMPIIFSAVFSIAAGVFAILYRIPKKLLSDEALARRAKKRQLISEESIEPGTDETVKSVSAECDAVAIKQGRGGAKKVWLRVGSVALSMFSAFLILSHLALPISYYPQLVDDVSNADFMRSGMQEVLPAIESITEHPVIRAYHFIDSPAIYCFDRISVPNGKGDSAQNTLKTIVSIVDVFTSLNDVQSNAETFYNVANLLDGNPFLDNLLVSALREMLSAWDQGEQWLGIDKDVFGDTSNFEIVHDYLQQCESASSALRTIGDLMKLIDLTEGGFDQDAIEHILSSFSTDGILLLKNVLLNSISESSPMSAEITESFIDSLLSTINSIKTDASLSDAQKAEILKQETKAIYQLFAVFNDPGDMDPKKIGESIAKSKAIAGAIGEVTNQGQVQDPCGLSDTLPNFFIDSVESGLEQGGASAEIQQIVRVFFGAN